MIQSDAAHSTGASATTPAAITSCRRVKAGASQSQYTPANTHASGRNSPASVSSPVSPASTKPSPPGVNGISASSIAPE